MPPTAGTSPLRRRRADAQANRAKILTAAAELCTTRGLDVSLNEIARRAAVGIATLQRNFAGREELVATVFTPRVRASADAVDRALEEPDPWVGFCGCVEHVAALRYEDQGLAVVLNTTFPTSSELEAHQRRAIRGFTRLVRRAKEAGALRPDFSPHDLPLLLFANADVVMGSGSDTGRASRRLIAFVLRACAVTDDNPLPSGAPLVVCYAPSTHPCRRLPVTDAPPRHGDRRPAAPAGTILAPGVGSRPVSEARSPRVGQDHAHRCARPPGGRRPRRPAAFPADRRTHV
ncbi:TetR family transcriptional regulator [Streptomyces sp. NPDC005921]|uniref:TetR family transcriptional regulator n=1 Tax=Streptomyces sp. NPDC005827 TaxID=3157070 RepID=UPI003402ECCC